MPDSLTQASIEAVIREMRKSGMSVPLTSLVTNCPIGTERVIDGKTYRLVADGPRRAKIMRVHADGSLASL